jgi:hypothetical protein
MPRQINQSVANLNWFGPIQAIEIVELLEVMIP